MHRLLSGKMRAGVRKVGSAAVCAAVLGVGSFFVSPSAFAQVATWTPPSGLAASDVVTSFTNGATPYITTAKRTSRSGLKISDENSLATIVDSGVITNRRSDSAKNRQ